MDGCEGDELDSRGMHDDDAGEWVRVEIAEQMMADPGLRLTYGAHSLEWNPAAVRWEMKTKTRRGLVVKQYTHVALGVLAMLGRI